MERHNDGFDLRGPPVLKHAAHAGLVPRPQTPDSDDGIIGVPAGQGDEIFMEPPKGKFLLGYMDVMCLVINRMIGTGIFNSPQTIMMGTNSTGAALLLWFAGIVYCLSGMHVYIEYGLNIPRYTIDRVEQSVPRSGGDLNYLQYVYRKPALRDNTVLLSACMFGIAFIALGNMAGNSIIFATHVLYAAGVPAPSTGAIRGIAIAIAGATCFIHAFSRRGGILLNNIFAVIKILLLVFVVITAIVAGAGGMPNTDPVLSENVKTTNSFKDASDEASNYAHAFLAVIYGFSGFEQPNYVLGEIGRPRRKYPIAMCASVTTIAVLYMAVNISYMVVVPKADQVNQACGSVAQRFFQLTFDSLDGKAPACNEDYRGNRAFNAFLAISSLGNIIVMTYTAARVKQEIAKEGIIPFARFFAQDRDMSLGRLLKWFQDRGWFYSLLRTRWLSPAEHSERTPVGALVLHLGSCLVLILASWNRDWTLLTKMFSYTINAFFGAFLGLGILILRFRGPPPTLGERETRGDATPPKTWTQMTGKGINPALSVFCATVYTIGGLWPVVTAWIKPADPDNNNNDSGGTDKDATTKNDWWLVPTISWSIIAAGVLWFLGFLAVAWWTLRKYQKVFVVEKKPEFEVADTGAGGDDKEGGHDADGLVLVHETVYLSWVAKETLTQRRPQSGRRDYEPSSPPPPVDVQPMEPTYQNTYGAPQFFPPSQGRNEMAFATGSQHMYQQQQQQQFQQPYQQQFQHEQQQQQYHEEQHHQQQYTEEQLHQQQQFLQEQHQQQLYQQELQQQQYQHHQQEQHQNGQYQQQDQQHQQHHQQQHHNPPQQQPYEAATGQEGWNQGNGRQ